MFDMETGAPAGEIKTEASTGFNDIEVAEDGTIYGDADRRRPRASNPDKATLAGVQDHPGRHGRRS